MERGGNPCNKIRKENENVEHRLKSVKIVVHRTTQRGQDEREENQKGA